MSNLGVDEVNVAEDENVTKYLKYQDAVSFFSEDIKGYLYCQGFGNTSLVIQPLGDRKTPTNFQGSVFIIHPKNAYAAQKKYRKEIDKLNSSTASRRSQRTTNEQMEQKLAVVKEQSEQEKKFNELENERLAGKTVYYGDVIQLLHFTTQRFMATTKRLQAELENANLKILLDRDGSKDCYYKILPRYKVRNEGEKIRIGDQIVLVNSKTQTFVHRCDKPFPDTNYEVNGGQYMTGWTVQQYASYNPNGDIVLNGGDTVRLFHKEVEGYLSSDITADPNKEGSSVYLKLVSSKSKTTSSSTTMWLIELENSVSGGTIPFKKIVRFRLQGTRQYLTMGKKIRSTPLEEWSLGLTFISTDPNTLFQLNPLNDEEGVIIFGNKTRIRHINSDTYIHACEEYAIDESVQKEDEGEKMVGFDKKSRRKLKISLLKKQNWEDVFAFIAVPKEEIEDLNFVSNLIPGINDFLAKAEEGKPNFYSKNQIKGVLESFKEMIIFCTNSENFDALDRKSVV